MADFLVPVSKSYRKGTEVDQFLGHSKTAEPEKAPEAVFKGSSPEEVLEALKRQPGHDTLLAVLEYLRNGGKHKHSFDIRTPGPLSAQIIHLLVTEITPNYWTALKESVDKSGLNALLDCLRSLPGINAALTYIRSLIGASSLDPKELRPSPVIFNLVYTLQLLESLLDGDGNLMHIWSFITSDNENTRVRPLRQEFLSVFTSGKIVSLSSQAEQICRQANRLTEPLWIADNKQYVNWLARNQICWAQSQLGNEDLALCAEIGARTMRLGHAGMFDCCLGRKHLTSRS